MRLGSSTRRLGGSRGGRWGGGSLGGEGGRGRRRLLRWCLRLVVVVVGSLWFGGWRGMGLELCRSVNEGCAVLYRATWLMRVVSCRRSGVKMRYNKLQYKKTNCFDLRISLASLHSKISSSPTYITMSSPLSPSTTLKVSSSTVDLRSASQKVWHQPFPIGSNLPLPITDCLLSLHTLHASLQKTGESLSGIHWSDCDSSGFNESHVLSLAPLSTHLTSLSLLQTSLPPSTLSPLLIASLGHATLLNLNLNLSCENINGLLGTVSACCYNLETFSLINSSGDEWNVNDSDLRLFSVSLLNLRVLELNGITFNSYNIEEEEKSSPTDLVFKLRGLKITNCVGVGEDVFRLFTESGSLLHFEFIYVLEFANEEEGTNLKASEIIQILGERNEKLSSLFLDGTGVRDYDVKCCFEYFKGLRRLGVGDNNLRVGGKGFEGGGELEGLWINNRYGGEEENEEMGEVEVEIDSSVLKYCGNLKEMGIVGLEEFDLKDFMGLQFLEEVVVEDCRGFNDPQEVCRLCRENINLVIRNGDGQVGFGGRFFDCEKDEEED